MNAGTIIWTTVLTVSVILLGWIGSVIDGKRHRKSINHLHNA